MRIQNNIAADNSHRQLGVNSRNIASNTEKLSSGLRVNRAADDAAGLAVSEKMRTQIRGLNRASLNIQDGVSLLQVGDGALQFVHDMMQRMRELSVQAANDTNQLIDREAIQLEFGQLTSEINAVMEQTNFNNKFLFDGSIGAAFKYHLGKMDAPYITNIPAAGDFVTPTNVEGWTLPPGFESSNATTANFGTAIRPIPDSGMFAMQIVTPQDGTLNVVINLSVMNNPQGTLDMDGFRNFFVTEFNSLGLGKVVENIQFIGNRFVFEFPKDIAGNLTGAMAKPPATEPVTQLHQPRVHVGVGGNALVMNSLNGTPTSELFPGDLNAVPGPFRANYTMAFQGSPTLSAGDFSVNNTYIFGGATVGAPSVRATLPGGMFPSVTIDFDGIPTKVTIAPGNYPDAKSFVDANKSAFERAMPNSFIIDIGDDGRLVITTEGQNPSPIVLPLTTNPGSLAAALGFASFGNVSTDPLSGGLWIQSGANRGDGIEISIPSLRTRSLGLSIRRPEDEDPDLHTNTLGAGGYTKIANVAGDPEEHSLDITSHEKASAALSVLTNAINIISMERARMGAQQNRLEFAMSNVDNTSENLQAAESRIRDVDMAAEMTTFVQNQILTQSSTAMLAQANALPNAMLQLLN